MSPLGLLNFLVLQWFGMRLARRMKRVLVNDGEIVWNVTTGAIDGRTKIELRPDGWKLLRWVWPLTGWWSDYRWIARRR